MTLSELQSLPPRERDSLVCHQVFGIPSPPFFTPRYSTDAAADLAVHREVCKRWVADGRLGTYFAVLGEVLARRDEDKTEDGRTLHGMRYYRVGDYATAAVVVAMGVSIEREG